MLSVAKLTLGQEAYYEQQVAGGLDDYYAGRGESPGIWVGSGAAALELSGVVGDGDLGTLLRGVDPSTQERLRSPVRERTITARTLDIERGEWRGERKRLAPVSGYDLVFSCPKSVSLVHALTDDERVRLEISEAHEAAWQAALAYLEREACVVRRGHGGATREHGNGFVAAAFRHRTSRAQDPHLHTHVIVANMAHTADGEWLALDGAAILKTYRLAAGYLYEAQLRHELTQRLGLEWTEPVKGMGELAQVPEDAVRAFSTRRRLLLEHMEALGTEGFAAARVAALATREAKGQVELPRLRERWLACAAEHGLGRRELRQLIHERRGRTVRREQEQFNAALRAVDGLTATQTTFTLPELVRAVAGSCRAGATAERVLEEAQALSRFPGIEPVDRGDVPGRPARFTTRELLDVERGALELALAGRGVAAPTTDGRTLLRALARSGLTREQQSLVRAASLSRDRVVCAIGVAGAGKTSAMAVLNEAFRECGVHVIGAAPSGRAADELATATGMPSSTLHRLLLDADRDGRLPRGCVLVVDEAGMAETRALASLLRLVEAAQGKAILVGDPAQLPPVGAGGLYPALCERLEVLQLGENRRQHEPSERQALALLRAGDPEPYLAHAARRGCLTSEDDAVAAKQRLLEDWWQAAAHDPEGTLMIAHRRADVRDLNDAAHNLMLRAGRLGQQARIIGGHEFRVGDRVLCRRNDPRLGLRNGTRATVIWFDRQTLTLRTDAGVSRLVPLGYAAEHLEHGYALTGHAAQGATVERAFVLVGDRGAMHEWGYVACSRARGETRLYLAGPSLEPDAQGREPEVDSAPARLARALTVSASEPLAVEQLEAGRATARVLAARRCELDQQRARATQRLADAEEKLDRLGWRRRGRRGSELRTEIAMQRAALRLAEQKLAEPIPTPESERVRADRDRVALARERPLQNRAPLQPSRARERERGLAIEL